MKGEAASDDHMDALRQQTVLARFGEVALRSEDLDEILTEACHLVGEALGTQLAKVMELQADGETLIVRAGVGWKPGVVGEVTIRVQDDTTEGHALKTGQPVISADIGTETRFRYPSLLIDNGVKAFANVLIIGGKDKRPFGILQVNSRHPRAFDDSDISFLRNYANLLAAAVDRLLVLDVLEAQVTKRTHALNEVNARMAVEAAEREQVERKLRQSQKMTAIGQLTGGIAHDFNNMLHAIGGSLELMSRRMEQGRAEEASCLLHDARKTVERAASLTNQLLVFARQHALQPQPVKPDVLIHGMVELIRRTVGSAIIVEELSCKGVWAVLSDHNQLHSALLNLAINARDAMPDGGTLTIRTQDVRLSVLDVADQDGAGPGEYVEIAIGDDGMGMDEATRMHAFEPFFTTKPAGQGTGLGLSQLHGFIHQSGGVVRLESAPGRGTTVRLYLPRSTSAREDNPSPTTEPELETIGANAVVLLVENELQVRAVIAEALRELRYQVLEASNSPAVLEVLHDSVFPRVDLLITEIGLSDERDGLQIAAAARAAKPNLPVLFITAGELFEDQLAPGTAVIGKPFTLNDIAAKIRGLIEAAAD